MPARQWRPPNAVPETRPPLFGKPSLQNQGQVGSNFEASIASEEQSLWIILAIESALVVVFPTLAVALLW